MHDCLLIVARFDVRRRLNFVVACLASLSIERVGLWVRKSVLLSLADTVNLEWSSCNSGKLHLMLMARVINEVS